MPDKILSFTHAPPVMAALRASGKTIVQCHGTFDLVHPGHIYHLQEAKAQGDVLVVTVTAEQFVNKGPGRPFFNDEVRAHSLAALEPVDHVIVVPHATAVEAIDCVRPHVYCKGREYESPGNDPTGNIHDDVRQVERYGGRVSYLGSVVFSSTKLLNNHFDHLGGAVKEFCRTLAAEFSPSDFRKEVESFAELNVLVIGDTIFDRYSSVNVQGLASKNTIVSGRFIGEETQCGGALAVFRHVKRFVNNVRFLSLVGQEAWVSATIADHVAPQEDLVLREEGFTTVVKQRFVQPLREGNELSKLFAVNYIDPHPPSKAIVERVRAKIAAEIRNADVVLLLDFGHGLMQEQIRNLVQDEAPFLALNCQTNSNNHGFNIISRQYRRADAFSLDEQEMMLACGHRHLDFESELRALQGALSAQYAWLTRGPVQTFGLRGDEPPVHCPPLETEVTDTVGAGDAFFSVASLAAVRGLPGSISTFLGQLAGAQAVKIVGNSQAISKQTLLKSGMSLLNF